VAEIPHFIRNDNLKKEASSGKAKGRSASLCLPTADYRMIVIPNGTKWNEES